MDGWLDPAKDPNRLYVRRRSAQQRRRENVVSSSSSAAQQQMADSSLISCHVEALPFLATLLSGLYLLVSMRLSKEGGLAIKGLDSIHIFAIRST